MATYFQSDVPVIFHPGVVMALSQGERNKTIYFLLNPLLKNPYGNLTRVAVQQNVSVYYFTNCQLHNLSFNAHITAQ